MAATGLELRPRTILDLIDGTIRLYRRNFTQLLSITAVVLIPLAIVDIVAQCLLVIGVPGLTTTQPGQLPDFSNVNITSFVIGVGLFSLYMLFLAIAAPLSDGALTIAVSEKYLGRDIGLKEAYQRALPHWATLIFITIIYGLLLSFGPMAGGIVGLVLGVVGAVGVGSAGISQNIAAAIGMGGMALGVLLAVPLMLLFTTWFILYSQVIVIEGARGIEALQRTRELVRGHGWHVFGTIILTGLAIGLIAMVLTIPVQIVGQLISKSRPEFLPHVTVLSQCLAHTIQVLVGPVFMVLQTLLYYDLRIRKEGFDLQMMAATLHPGADYTDFQAPPPLTVEPGVSATTYAPPPIERPPVAPPIVGPAVPPPGPPTVAPPEPPPEER